MNAVSVSNKPTDPITRDLATCVAMANKLGAPLGLPLKEACRALQAVNQKVREVHSTISKRYGGASFTIRKLGEAAAANAPVAAEWGYASNEASKSSARDNAERDAMVQICDEVLNTEGGEQALRQLGDRAHDACVKAETLVDAQQARFVSLFGEPSEDTSAIVFLSTVEKAKSLTPKELEAEWIRLLAVDVDRCRVEFEPAALRACDAIIDHGAPTHAQRRDARFDHASDMPSEAALLKRRILTVREQRVPKDVAIAREVLSKLHAVYLELMGISGRYVSYAEYIAKSSRNPNALMSKWDQYPTWPTRFLPGSPYRLAE